MRRRIVTALSAVAVLIVAGCSGVPTSSGPQVVRSIGFGESPPPTVAAPAENAAPLTIVDDFRKAMASSPDRLDAARAYLDAEAAKKWSTSTVTIVKSGTLRLQGDPEDPGRVRVTYQPIGSLSADGIYTPQTLQGDGVGSPVPATYFLAQNSDHQWRITSPVPAGLFITDADFLAQYTPKSLYFPDTSGARLVPDLRYSALADSSLETFLLAQLVKGPRPELANVVSPFAPVVTGNQRPSVTPGDPTIVQLPGAAALDDPTKTRLAAQLAFTLRPSFQSELQIRDGTQTVAIPGVGDTFDFTAFGQFAPSDDDVATATYVRGGAVVDADGAPIAGRLGTSTYALDTAVFDEQSGASLVAGTTGTLGDGGSRRLLVGDTSGLRDVGVPAGPLTPPVWAPVGGNGDADEVWVASRDQVYRYVPGQRDQRPTTVAIGGQTDLAGTTITSMAFSPEGLRLLLVIRSADATTSQVWLASVVRTGPDVQLTQLEPVTPTGYDIVDAGWRSDTLVAAVGTASGFTTGLYLSVAVDGSRLGPPVSTDGLPDRPSTLAVSPRSVTQWVTVGSGAGASVWSRSSTTGPWMPPSGSSAQSGYAPSFSTD